MIIDLSDKHRDCQLVMILYDEFRVNNLSDKFNSSIIETIEMFRSRKNNKSNL